MGRIIHHGREYVIKRFTNNLDGRMIISILAAELGMFLFVAYKGLALQFLPITLLSLLFTVVSCSIGFYYKADKYLLVFVFILLNLGFMIQQIQKGESSNEYILSFIMKYILAICTALVVAAFYNRVAPIMSNDSMIIVMMTVQVIISLLMIKFGRGSGAKITLGGLSLLELVKVIYIFVAVGLLCNKGNKYFKLIKYNINREMLFIIYTAVLAICFLACSELGTLMIVYISGLILLWIYGENRAVNIGLIIFSIIGFMTLWVLCDQILYPIHISKDNSSALSSLMNIDAVGKVVERFGTALHPEKSFFATGGQGSRALEAIVIGGTTGLATERHRIKISEDANDFVFANIVQTCGFLIGVTVIVIFFVVLYRGLIIAKKCKDMYYQGIAVGITVVIAVEAIIHIGYNTASFPITGIPLYFVSQGFMATITGMALISILLVISSRYMLKGD